MTLRYLSLFSGIEAATVAWAPLGWECVAVCEVDKFPSTVLAHHYPTVRNLGDVTKVTEEDIAMLGRIDLVVFGSPCQDLSVAGKRKGFDGERSSLFFTAIDIVQWARTWGGARWALWENVPGAFSSNQGRDFAAVVDALAGLDGTAVPPKGWGTEGCAVGEEAMVEWSTLDAQWFGVAQKRRRVFALADFGDWANRPPILLEPEGMRGDSAPSRGTRKDVAGTLAARIGGGGFPGTDEALDGYVVAQQRPVLTQAFGGNNTSGPIDVATARNACASASGRMDFESETFVVQSVIAFNSDTQPDEMRSQHSAVLAFTCKDYGGDCAIGVTPTLRAMGHSGSHANAGGQLAVSKDMQVRRLTPTECERLQAFPDGYTLVPVRGKPAADGPRYKALGNSMCVNVMRWIGREIDFAWRFF